MGLLKKKKCRHCNKLFYPDPRNEKRQKYCSESACQKASKKASQRRWLQKPENQNYFKGPDNVKESGSGERPIRDIGVENPKFVQMRYKIP